MTDNQKIIGEDKIVSIKEVVPNTWNPKEAIEKNEHNRQRFEEIKEEIKNKGQFEAITVREKGKKYEILDGYHRWRACCELEFSQIRINNLGKIDDKLAKAITLIKEQKKVPLSELMVAEVVGEMAKEFNDLSELAKMLGYSEETTEDYIKMFEFDWDQFDNKELSTDNEQQEDNTSGNEDDSDIIECPECKHKFRL